MFLISHIYYIYHTSNPRAAQLAEAIFKQFLGFGVDWLTETLPNINASDHLWNFSRKCLFRINSQMDNNCDKICGVIFRRVRNTRDTDAAVVCQSQYLEGG